MADLYGGHAIRCGAPPGYGRPADLADSRDHIIPGHDPRVMDLYPSKPPDLEGNVVQPDRLPSRTRWSNSAFRLVDHGGVVGIRADFSHGIGPIGQAGFSEGRILPRGLAHRDSCRDVLCHQSQREA